MYVVKWLTLQLREAEIQSLQENISGVVDVRKVCQRLLHSILEQYPWDGRTYLISFYHPYKTYSAGESIALPMPDPQGLRPMAWQSPPPRYVTANRSLTWQSPPDPRLNLMPPFGVREATAKSPA